VEQWTYDNPAGLGDLIPRVKKMQPEVVLFAGEVGDLPALRGHLQNADLHGPLLVGEDTFATIPLDARDNVCLATCFAPEAVAEGQDFVRKYRERYHEAPDVHAALAYEAIRTMCKAMNQNKGTSGPDVRKELAGAESFPGVIGPLSFAKDHTVRRPALVLQWKDGQATVAERYAAE
jgi:branched-chain amino acid transport system substrate-binding protein